MENSAIAGTLDHVPEYYRRKTAMAHWACQKIREAGGLSIFAHPFWMPRRYNVSRDLLDILFDEKIFDALELLNGIGVDTPEEGYRALLDFKSSYGALDPTVCGYLNRWCFDYVIYYGLDP